MTIYLTKCTHGYLIKDGNIHYGQIFLTKKIGIIQWIYIPIHDPKMVVLLTSSDLQIIKDKIDELNKRDCFLDVK